MNPFWNEAVTKLNTLQMLLPSQTVTVWGELHSFQGHTCQVWNECCAILDILAVNQAILYVGKC